MSFQQMLHPNAFKQTSDDLDLEHLKQSFGFSVKVPKLHLYNFCQSPRQSLC